MSKSRGEQFLRPHHDPRTRFEEFQLLSRLVFRDKLRQRVISRWLDKALSEPNAFVVQVGAFDGAHDDPLQSPIRKHSPAGLLIEPQGDAFKKLAKLYETNSRIQCLQTAIGEVAGTLTLWHAETGRSAFGPANASADRAQVERGIKRHVVRRMLQGSNIISEEVPITRLDTLLAEQDIAPDDVTTFVCDAEGADAQIVNQLLDYGARPSVVMFEHLHAHSSQVVPLGSRLLGYGYTLLATYKDMVATTGDYAP